MVVKVSQQLTIERKVLVHIRDDPNDPTAQAVWRFHRKRMAGLGRGDEEPLVRCVRNRMTGAHLIETWA